MRRHKKAIKRNRKFGTTDDGLFLERIKSGTLRVEDGKVWTCFSGGKVTNKWKEMVIEESDDGYYLIRCYLNGKRRRTRLHRLVWIAEKMELIPEGFDIHHIDHDRKNNMIDNLEMVESYGHRISHFSWNEIDESDIMDWEPVNDWGIKGIPF